MDETVLADILKCELLGQGAKPLIEDAPECRKQYTETEITRDNDACLQLLILFSMYTEESVRAAAQNVCQVGTFFSCVEETHTVKLDYFKRCKFCSNATADSVYFIGNGLEFTPVKIFTK